MERTRNTSLTIAFCLPALLLLPAAASAAPMYFNYEANVYQSDRGGAPVGSVLTGQFSYDPDEIQFQFGSDYRPFFGTSTLSAYGSEGFSLEMDIRNISLFSGFQDSITMQTFISESPNDWHMVIDIVDPGGPGGWLEGDTSLPGSFPDMLDNAFLSIYFTDEFDWVRNVEAQIFSITPADGPISVVPIPAAAWLFGSALLALAGLRRGRAQTG